MCLKPMTNLGEGSEQLERCIARCNEIAYVLAVQTIESPGFGLLLLKWVRNLDVRGQGRIESTMPKAPGT